jgi:uncharacterized protein (TIGR02996 family)
MTEEQSFLNAIREQPDDDARKLVYADWLEEQGDPRAEYLRLMVQVRRDRAVTPEQRQRHQELFGELADFSSRLRQARGAGGGPSRESRDLLRRLETVERQLADLSRQMRQPASDGLKELAALDPNWLAVVSDPEVEVCGKGGNDWPIRFDFVCDQSWADMAPTGDDRVRHCRACSKDVHFCDNIADAREHAHAEHCIAVDLGVIRRDGDLRQRGMFLGRPSPEDIRSSYEEDVDPVSRARLGARKKAGSPRTGRR